MDDRRLTSPMFSSSFDPCKPFSQQTCGSRRSMSVLVVAEFHDEILLPRMLIHSPLVRNLNRGYGGHERNLFTINKYINYLANYNVVISFTGEMSVKSLSVV